ncbi:collagen alpha-1(III) chain-like [Perognathus longimembris pacificus]|uniref:collagen alpha-1(III) chain-like n=1 Tax=Perognathus longimembris pacificus TaxID=214514 RepID=UPI002019FEF8|nr:collagen alpha-1(III) chain-like [Perognathus longimembris pacificus]
MGKEAASEGGAEQSCWLPKAPSVTRSKEEPEELRSGGRSSPAPGRPGQERRTEQPGSRPPRSGAEDAAARLPAARLRSGGRSSPAPGRPGQERRTQQPGSRPPGRVRVSWPSLPAGFPVLRVSLWEAARAEERAARWGPGPQPGPEGPPESGGEARRPGPRCRHGVCWKASFVTPGSPAGPAQPLPRWLAVPAERPGAATPGPRRPRVPTGARQPSRAALVSLRSRAAFRRKEAEEACGDGRGAGEARGADREAQLPLWPRKRTERDDVRVPGGAGPRCTINAGLNDCDTRAFPELSWQAGDGRLSSDPGAGRAEVGRHGEPLLCPASPSGGHRARGSPGLGAAPPHLGPSARAAPESPEPGLPETRPHFRSAFLAPPARPAWFTFSTLLKERPQPGRPPPLRSPDGRLPSAARTAASPPQPGRPPPLRDTPAPPQTQGLVATQPPAGPTALCHPRRAPGSKSESSGNRQGRSHAGTRPRRALLGDTRQELGGPGRARSPGSQSVSERKTWLPGGPSRAVGARSPRTRVEGSTETVCEARTEARRRPSSPLTPQSQTRSRGSRGGAPALTGKARGPHSGGPSTAEGGGKVGGLRGARLGVSWRGALGEGHGATVTPSGSGNGKLEGPSSHGIPARGGPAHATSLPSEEAEAQAREPTPPARGSGTDLAARIKDQLSPVTPHGGPREALVPSPVTPHGGPREALVPSPVTPHGGPREALVPSPVTPHGGPREALVPRRRGSAPAHPHRVRCKFVGAGHFLGRTKTKPTLLPGFSAVPPARHHHGHPQSQPPCRRASGGHAPPTGRVGAAEGLCRLHLERCLESPRKGLPGVRLQPGSRPANEFRHRWQR